MLQLQRMGIDPVVVVNGREAVTAAATVVYDLILMDCQMPELDGFDATQRIREREAQGAARTPIIALTANAMAGDRETCLAAGMDGYLAKPVSMTDLKAALDTWLPQEDAAGTVSPSTPATPISPAGWPLHPANLDETVLMRLRKITPDAEGLVFLTELVDLFAEETPKLLVRMREALKADDATALRFAAHSLKGACANLGLRTLTAQARALEEQADAGRLDGANAAVLEIAKALPQAEAALRTWVTAA